MDFFGPDVEPERMKEAVRRRRRAFLYAVPNTISWLMEKRSDTTENITDFTDVEKSVQPAEPPRNSQSSEIRPGIHSLSQRSPMYSRTPTEAGVGSSLLTSQDPTVKDYETLILSLKAKEHGVADASLVESNSNDDSSSTSSVVTRLFKRSVRCLRFFASTLFTPASIAILLSFLIALIPPLKGLFTPLPLSNSTSTFANPHIHPAPDGLPPLSIILDTTTFIGAASVPLGLICLGSALARLKVPRNQWETLPTGAITSLAIGKMVITPILGVGIVKGLVKGSVISEDDKLLQFVCM
ncbi:hypothetical protein C0993_002289 [Termitomyces sp. T159_Od127]|nr:hypothetical protein C0993_002289 [Termitomyces sp. T159_Od127]